MGTLAAGGATPAAAGTPQRVPVIDGMMHLEMYDTPQHGKYWEGMCEEILEHYEHRD